MSRIAPRPAGGIALGTNHTATPTALKQSLASIRTGSPGYPPKTIAYGRPAVGKTSFAAAAEKPLFIMSPQETGLHTLIDAGTVADTVASIEIIDWASLIGLLGELATAVHPYKTIVMDVIGGMEALACAVVKKRAYDNDDEKFMNFHKGYTTVAMSEWKQMLIALDALNKKGIQIVLLGHAEAKTEKNPLGADYTRMTPAVSKAVWNTTFAWADVVVFLDYEINLGKIASDKTGGKVKGTGGDDRVMRTQWNAAFDAKSRYGIPSEIPMGSSGAEAWKNLQDAIKASINTPAPVEPK